MKTIYLKSLSLRNFKGIKKLDLSFDKHETNIHGANGTGKTTVFDAFTWVLFGKDSSDRKDFNIKTLNPNGTNVEKTEHTVTAVLSVDGKEITLHRIYRENWVKKRGEADAELKGHETLFYINDVPKKAGEYAAEISEIVDESVFKLITNPQYFPAMKWQDQREILFKIAGTVSDQEIANGNREFEKLLEKLDGKKLADYKIQIAATKRKLKADLEAIPTRIDEAENAKPEAFDFVAIESQIEDKELQQKLSHKAIIEQQNKRVAQLSAEMKHVAQQISDLEKDEFTLETFTRAKIDEAENRINNRFSFVKFKLFDTQINGAEVETCQALINGVPYSDANTASKINAGIDIINVLCDFNDVTAPIWLDNRESVSEIIYTESQVINLIVNQEYKKLMLK